MAWCMPVPAPGESRFKEFGFSLSVSVTCSSLRQTYLVTFVDRRIFVPILTGRTIGVIFDTWHVWLARAKQVRRSGILIEDKEQ